MALKDRIRCLLGDHYYQFIDDYPFTYECWFCGKVVKCL